VEESSKFNDEDTVPRTITLRKPAASKGGNWGPGSRRHCCADGFRQSLVEGEVFMLFDVFMSNKLMLIPKVTHERMSEKAMKDIGSEQSGKRTENVHKTQRRP
jgi:hypothetical protein